jgi:hypothetical protein
MEAIRQSRRFHRGGRLRERMKGHTAKPLISSRRPRKRRRRG